MRYTSVREQLKNLVSLIRDATFPKFAETRSDVRVYIKDVLSDLLRNVHSVDEIKVVEGFMLQLDEIIDLLHTDVAAVSENDPAVESVEEVILCYPLTTVMLYYRTAHALHELGIPLLPRLLTEIAHSKTGVDIHPAAKIGEYFCFDHGTGIVIGATAVIGKHVVLYQGVTLGARNFKYDQDGIPMDIPRHPILEDNVTVYSNTSILGRVRIGHDTIVGGNIWLTHDVPPYSRSLQTKALEMPTFVDGAGI